MNIGLKLVPGTLPYNCYPANPQDLINTAFALGSAESVGLTGIVVSDSTPGPEDWDKGWLKTSSGFPIGLFKYAGGHWIFPHLSAPGGSERRLWVGSLPELVTFDGGDTTLIGDASGAMWTVDDEFVGRIPIGPGLIPDTATTLAVNANSGSGVHTILEAELPPHAHKLPVTLLKEGAGQVSQPVTGPAVGSPLYPPASDTLPTDGGLGTSTPMSIVQPVRASYFIKRTSRKYYRGDS